MFKAFLKNAIVYKLSYDDFKQHRLLGALEDLQPADVVLLKAALMEPADAESNRQMSGSHIGTLKFRMPDYSEGQIEAIVGDIERLGLGEFRSLKTTMTSPGAGDLLRPA